MAAGKIRYYIRKFGRKKKRWWLKQVRVRRGRLEIRDRIQIIKINKTVRTAWGVSRLGIFLLGDARGYSPRFWDTKKHSY